MSDFNYQDYLKNNPLLNEGKVSKKEWESMNDDKRMDALLSAIKDPDEAEKYVESKWDDLPPTVTQNMRVDEQLESDEDFGTGGEEVESLAADVVMGRISYKDAREKASKAAFSMKELNNAIAYVEDITGKSAPSYSIGEDYDPDAEQDDEDVPNPVDDEGRPLGEAEMKLKDEAMVYYIGKLMDKEIDKLPEDPLRAYMNMLTQDQMDHDAETLSREIGENKMDKMDKINERLNVSRDALTKVYKELGATTFSQMILNIRDENVLDELANEMGNQYRGVMQEARDYGMTYPSYKVEEFNTIGDMAQNGILNLLAFAEQYKPELAGKLKSLVNDVTEVIYDDMEEFDTQPRISVKETIKEQVEEMVKGAVKVFKKEGGALGVKALEDGLSLDTKKAKALLKTMIKKDLVFLHRDGDYILKEGHGLTTDDVKVIEKTIDDSSDDKLTDILKFIVKSNIKVAKRQDLSKDKKW